MACQRCGKDRILDISVKCDDRCSAEYMGLESHDYAPRLDVIDGGDYVAFKVCMECGQHQGNFPVTDATVREAFGIEEEED
jgi:hypothetical protein